MTARLRAPGFPRAGLFLVLGTLFCAALIIAADPWRTMPRAALDHLERIPHVVIGRSRDCPRRTARVHFTAASPGIDTTGTAYRMDKVPLPIRAALPSTRPTDEQILRAILDTLRS